MPSSTTPETDAAARPAEESRKAESRAAFIFGSRKDNERENGEGENDERENEVKRLVLIVEEVVEVVHFNELPG